VAFDTSCRSYIMQILGVQESGELGCPRGASWRKKDAASRGRDPLEVGQVEGTIQGSVGGPLSSEISQGAETPVTCNNYSRV
jgi:hypothetical protein